MICKACSTYKQQLAKVTGLFRQLLTEKLIDAFKPEEIQAIEDKILNLLVD